MLRFANYIMILLFAISAVVQYNDPEPVRWILIYAAACIICILYAKNKLNWPGGAAVGGIAVIWALVKIPELTAHGFRHMFGDLQMMQPGVEAAREFVGLLIICTWMAVLAASTYVGRTSPSDNS